MKSLILRVVLVSMVAFTMLGAAPKQKPIFGTLYFEDVASGSSSITNPTAGVCYDVPSHALSAKNETDTFVTVFRGPKCNVGAKQVGPGNHSSANFGSFIFQK